MKRSTVRRLFLGLAIVLVLGVGSLWRARSIPNPARWGETMGTTYSIRIAGKVKRSGLKALTQRIDATLVEVNHEMSTWDHESEIWRFNHTASTDPIQVSEGFAEVVQRALGFSKSTDGAFDPTLQPLLNLWGFGSEGGARHVPSEAEIAAVKEETGWHKVSVESPTVLRKSQPDISLALGGIAKGYGVDRVGRILEEDGHENWFVEIGGEVVAKGLNPEGVPWRIGIQYPTTNPMDERLEGVASITQGAIATSGNYRNYVESNGAIYSHILDPRTGRAIHTNTASVSVYASNCTDADALATALYVMGPDEGIAWVERHPGIEAMFLVWTDSGEIIEKFSSGFVKATSYSAADGSERPK